MAKGLYLTSDGQVLVEYSKRRRVPISSAQYKANGYKPPCEKLPPEVPRKVKAWICWKLGAGLTGPAA